jgi:hypothetical protein
MSEIVDLWMGMVEEFLDNPDMFQKAAKGVYGASPIKSGRATKAEMEARAEALIDIVEDVAPASVRGIFYQATVRGVIEKTENGYKKVGRLLVQLRRAGLINYSDIADNTRWMRKPKSHSSLEAALDHTARTYRKALWDDTDEYIEIWLEKDALSGVILPITTQFDVPLMVSRGYASLTFLSNAAEIMKEEGRPCYIYHLGDWDPSGQDAARHIEETLHDLAPYAEIHFERIAVTQEQIEEWNLPSRPTKSSDSRSKKWRGGDSVELDAIHPDQLRELVQAAIEQHLPPEKFDHLKVAEESERELLEAWIERLKVAS